VEQRPLPVSCSDFIDERKWVRVQELATFSCFESLPDEIERQPQEWRRFLQCHSQPGTPEAVEAPSPFSKTELPDFTSILLRRCLKPELTLEAIRAFVEAALGPAFVRPTAVNLKELYDARSKASTPMLMLLTPGNDPMETIERLAEERLRTRHPLRVSLGKG